MKILHIAPHLGGGVGKAHAAISAALPKEAVRQTFVLLEQPKDRRYVEMVEGAGACVAVAENLDQIADLAGEADIVQFEFWNHPRLFECLARCDFRPMRSVFWSHISGLFKPLIPPGLIQESARFVFTTEASRSIPYVAQATPRKTSVINSGFGFATVSPRARRRDNRPVIAYLGTIDFIKMHPGFFEAIDRLEGNDISVAVWGRDDPSSAVAAKARAMQHPERVIFMGETDAPAAALTNADIFFYPLQPDHYGTAENALVEAMSLGLVPVVLNNPAEMAIVRDGQTGFVANSFEDCTSILDMLLSSPDLRERVGQNAARHVAETRTAAHSVQDLMILWLGLLAEEPRHCDFCSAVGDTPADWFLATQRLPGTDWKLSGRPGAENAAKGTLAHFESVFAGDASLLRLRA
ncbi:MAG: glycosyltransferase family 4 protein [Pseudolabrys sp.]